MNKLEEICKQLQAASTVSIIMHRRPDGDAVGSAVALGLALQQQGKEVRLICTDAITPKYQELTIPFGGLSKQVEGLVVCVDLATAEMAGAYRDAAQNADIVIDHHGSNSGYGKRQLVVPTAAACGEIIYEVVCMLGSLTPAMAAAIYIAVSTDTGCFRYSNTTQNTHRVAAAVMAAGIPTAEINRRLFIEMSPQAFAIRRAALDSMVSRLDGKVRLMMVTLSMMQQSGAMEDDVENISSIPMEFAGTIVAATLRESEDGKYKVSLRSNGSVDVSAICATFGGGGHRSAAGCLMEGDQKSAQDKLLQQMTAAVKGLEDGRIVTD